jgi:hypothetical protein
MSETNGTRELPASKVLMRCLKEIGETASRQMDEVIREGLIESGQPIGTKLDVARGVWVRPDTTPANVPAP